MVRLNRAQQQERTRAAVLAAARHEFGEYGYVDAKVDRIAERAELTRGAVYSNFPGKRGLYLAVLLDSTEEAGVAAAPPADLAGALGAFARHWLARLPLTSNTGRLATRSLSGVFDDEPGRAVLAQVSTLEALLLGLALESCAPGRRVRLAELVLTLLHGAGHLAESAPGFGAPFDVARACEHLASLDLDDEWDPPHLRYVSPTRSAWPGWQPPADLPDLLTGRPVGIGGDGVVAVLGAGRLEAAEEAVRAAGPDRRVTVAVVTDHPAETGRLVRLRVGDLAGCLRAVFGADPLPGLRVVLDDAGALGASAADGTEVALLVRAGGVLARVEGRGAGHVAATGGEA